MGRYQFFKMDRAGARGDAVSLALPDDAAAIRRALSREFRDGCELWDGFRFIGRFYGPDACRPPADEIDGTINESEPAAAPTKVLVH